MRVKAATFALIWLVWTWLACARAWSHPADLGRLQTAARGQEILFTLQMPAALMSAIAVIDTAKLMPENAPRVAHAAFLNTLGQAALLRAGSACQWETPHLTGGDPVRLTVAARCAGQGAWSLALPFLDQAPPAFQLIVKDESGAVPREWVMTAADHQLRGGEGGNPGWSAFLLMGVKHIGAWPTEWRGGLPDGIDHILFLVALILGGGGILQQLKTVTGFTVGHSVTLALATLGVVALPSRVVESAIAASIVYVAVESQVQKKPHSRWALAFGFGMVHGLGFASALAALHLDKAQLVRTLVVFNIGVELGQIVILCVVFPVLLAVRRFAWARRYLIPGSLAAIAVTGSVWFVRRVFGLT
jgi:hypothetical protein